MFIAHPEPFQNMMVTISYYELFTLVVQMDFAQPLNLKIFIDISSLQTESKFPGNKIVPEIRPATIQTHELFNINLQIGFDLRFPFSTNCTILSSCSSFSELALYFDIQAS